MAINWGPNYCQQFAVVSSWGLEIKDQNSWAAVLLFIMWSPLQCKDIERYRDRINFSYQRESPVEMNSSSYYCASLCSRIETNISSHFDALSCSCARSDGDSFYSVQCAIVPAIVHAWCRACVNKSGTHSY